MRRRIDREEQAVGLQRRVEMAEHDARLDHCAAALGVDRSTLRRYFEQSSTRARLTVWPHWLVPPPRANTGTPLSRAIASGSRHPRSCAARERRRFDLIDGGVGRIAATVGAREQHLAARLTP